MVVFPNRGSGISVLILRVVYNFEKNRFLTKNIRKFFKRSVTIWEHIRNCTPYRIYANNSPEDPLSNRGSAIAELILRVEILNFEKNRFLTKSK